MRRVITYGVFTTARFVERSTSCTDPGVEKIRLISEPSVIRTITPQSATITSATEPILRNVEVPTPGRYAPEAGTCREATGVSLI